jgi:hypothetical protein
VLLIGGRIARIGDAHKLEPEERAMAG